MRITEYPLLRLGLAIVGLETSGPRSLAAPADYSKTALIVVAHGSRDSGWNDRVVQTVEKLDWPGPKGVAFLSSPSPEYDLSTVASKLDQPQIQKIVIVPLLVSSFSGHYEELRCYAGQPNTLMHGPTADHGALVPLKTRAPIVLTPAMDGDPKISAILADQVRVTVRRDGVRPQSIVLVAHGPSEDTENERWLANLRAHARYLKDHYGFARVTAVTLRDDASKSVRDAATVELRNAVRSASADSQVWVLPVLISVGHIQKEIAKRLEGLDFTMVQFGLADHPLAASWVREQAVRACN